MTRSVEEKFEHLKSILREMESVVVGYSGGVDSTFLCKVATDVLGERALSVAAISESYPEHERVEAEEFARSLGLNFETVHTLELENPDYRKNAPNRCYYCKQELVTHLGQMARMRGFRHTAIGTNFDDLGDYRPGQEAAREGGTRFPLVEAEITKEDIRILSRRLGIPTWDKPSFACLSSRFPYGEEITREKLEMVDKAETVLRRLGFGQFRVRHHKDLARIEVLPENMELALRHREEIVRQFKQIGYTYVAMDLLGYRTGSMNEVLHQIGNMVNA